jgi:uncharacterized protein
MGGLIGLLTLDKLKRGEAAFKREDFAAALGLLRPMAERGNALAMAYLGNMYAKGLGTKQDQSEAVRWLTHSAELGNAWAQAFLAQLYETGDGVAKDDAKAFKWYGMAAEQGLREAKNKLGYLIALVTVTARSRSHERPAYLPRLLKNDVRRSSFYLTF